MPAILGIDIAKEKFDIVLLQDSQTPQNGEFANTPAGFKQLQRFLKKRQVDELHACLEATGLYSEPVATFLYEQGYTVSVVNPQRIHAYAQSQLQRNKTDRQDAALIAEFCLRHELPRWTPPPRNGANSSNWCGIWLTWRKCANKNATASKPAS